MFLLRFHLPVLVRRGPARPRAPGTAGWTAPFDPAGVFVLWTLLFLGPLLEVGTGLLVAGASPATRPYTVFFLAPVRRVDGGLHQGLDRRVPSGARYRWAKTERTSPVRR